MAQNKDLNQAKAQKNDEFYTQLADIENELRFFRSFHPKKKKSARHPVAGMICGYAATEAGFTANIMVAGTDGLLQAITQRTADDFLGEGVR